MSGQYVHRFLAVCVKRAEVLILSIDYSALKLFELKSLTGVSEINYNSSHGLITGAVLAVGLL